MGRGDAPRVSKKARALKAVVAAVADNAKEEVGGRFGVCATILGEGRLSEVGGLKPLNPASNMKVLNAALVLDKLGPRYRFTSRVRGTLQGGEVPLLILQSDGDPSLTRKDLLAFAHALHQKGVRRVGAIKVDASYFDNQVLPPGFESQPHEAATFRSAISAVAVDRASYTLSVNPGSGDGDRARVLVTGSGYFEVENRIVTKGGVGEMRIVADQREKDDGRLRLLLSGTIPFSHAGTRFNRRVAQPALHAGYVLKDALKAVGIRAPKTVSVTYDGSGTQKHATLAARLSPPVAELLHQLGKHSDNFYAEMLFKAVGAKISQPGKTARAVKALRALMKAAGAQLPSGTVFKNGSGLWGSRVAPCDVIKTMAAALKNPATRHDYVAQLALAGRDGTLRKRQPALPKNTVVRAKTGTLNGVITLSGLIYVGTQKPIIFSMMFNDVSGKHGKARSFIDRALAEIASALTKP